MKICPLANVSMNLPIYQSIIAHISQNAVWFLFAIGELIHFMANFLTVSMCTEFGPPVLIVDYMPKSYGSWLSKNIILEFLNIRDPEYSFILKQPNQLPSPLHFNNNLHFQKEPFHCIS